MVEEISLSIEETNKLRASIGLEPIPENESNVDDSNHKKHQDSSSNVRHEISIEETNKLRLSLGLKPIPIDADTTTSVTEADEVKKNERESSLKKRIDDSKSRNLARKRFANGKTLLDDDLLESTDDWLSRVGQPKEKAKRKRTPTEVSDETNGMRVGHSSKDLLTLGDNEILTLNDTSVLEGGEAELTNEKLTRTNKLKKELNDKIEADHVKHNGRRIRGFSIEDEEEGDIEEENSIMIQNATIALPNSDNTLSESSKKTASSTGAIKISSLFAESELPDIDQANDYSRPKKPQKIKKLKKKSSLNSRCKKEDLIDANDEEEINIKPVELKDLETDLLTDELELDSMLATNRRQRQKARKFMTPEDLANELKQHERWDEENKLDDLVVSTQGKGGIVYDDTSDFLNSLSTNILASQDDSNINLVKAESELNSVPVKTEPKIKEEEDDMVYSKSDSDGHSQQKNSGNTIVKNEDQRENVETNETPAFNGGLASTLKFLQLRNILQLHTPELNKQSRLQQNALKDAELKKLKISIESRLLREQLESDRSFMNLPKEEREAIFESQLDEVLKEKNIFSSSKSSNRDTTSNLSNYSPSVKLSYRDESGNTLNTKEAFKFLSHKFHGVGPGRGKIDKRLKKIQQARDQNSSNNEEII